MQSYNPPIQKCLTFKFALSAFQMVSNGFAAKHMLNNTYFSLSSLEQCLRLYPVDHVFCKRIAYSDSIQLYRGSVPLSILGTIFLQWHHNLNKYDTRLHP